MKNNSLLSKDKDYYLKVVFNLLLVLFPIMGAYKSLLESVNAGELLFMISLPLFLIDAVNKKTQWSPYWLFLLFGIATTYIAVVVEISTDYFNVTFMILRLLFHAVIYLWLAKIYFDMKIFILIYKTIAYAAVVFILLQWLVFAATGYLIPYLIPWMKLRWTIENPAEIYYFRIHESQLRLSSFFVEPADYAQFVTPLYIYVLFKKIKITKDEIVFVFMLLVSVIISTSALFVISIFAITALWYVMRLQYHNGDVRCLMTVALIVILITLFFIVFRNNEWVQKMFQRFSEIDPSKGATSGNMRVLRGFAVFSELNLINKIFGVGVGNTAHYMVNHGISTAYDYGKTDNQLNFMSSFSNILVWNGFAGAMLYIYLTVRQLFRSNGIAKVMMFYLVILMFSASIYVVPTYPFLMTIIIGNEKEYNGGEKIEWY